MYDVQQEMERQRKFGPEEPETYEERDPLSLFIITLKQHHSYVPKSRCEELSIHTVTVVVSGSDEF